MLLMISTPNDVLPLHLFTIIPFLSIIVARFISLFWSDKLVLKIIFFVLLGLLVFFNFRTTYTLMNFLSDQTNLELSESQLSKINYLVKNYLSNSSKIVTAQYNHPYTPLYFSLGRDKEIFQMCRIEIVGTWYDWVNEANCSEAEKILDEAFKDPKSRYIFPAKFRRDAKIISERDLLSSVFLS